MRQRGKYEAPRGKVNKNQCSEKHLMRTLVSSVMSVLLCSTMFLSTTMAWFTDTVTSSGNQIVVGELKVGAYIYNNDGTSYSLKDTDTPIFKDTVWAPGVFEVKTLAVENQGSLDVVYTLNFSLATSSGENAAEIAKHMQVYVKEIGEAAAVSNYTLEDIQAWGAVGGSDATLATVFNDGISGISNGEIPAAVPGARTASRRVYAIALYMKESLPQALMGEKMDLNIILNAYQANAPEAEKIYSGNIETYTGVQTEPIVFEGGTLILDGVEMNKLGETHAITIKGNTQLQLKGSNTLTAPEGYTAIYVEKGATLELYGDNLTATGNGGTDTAAGGHGIGGYGNIYIRDVQKLIARGFGTNGFGIGGPTSSIIIKNTYIEAVQGGYANTENKGGAAIGSHTDGAVITLNNVKIDSALGGGRSAGIGAMYHTGVTVNITDSTLSNIHGGYGSAGVGGSLIEKDAAQEQKVSVNIVNSTVKAVGGQYGAGIGSGYDPNSSPKLTFPICVINIDGNSNIMATGGQYAAGVGTGYQAGGLSGEIKSTVTATAGEPTGTATHTVPQAIGFGALKQDAITDNNCSITYLNNSVKIPTE